MKYIELNRIFLHIPSFFPLMKRNLDERTWVTQDFGIMLQIVILNSLGFFYLDFIIPYVSTQILNTTGTQLGIIFSLQTAGYTMCAFFVGFLADRYSKKTLVAIGGIGRGIAYFVLYFAILARSFLFMAIGVLSLGILVGLFWIPYNALLSQKSDKNHRSFAFGEKNKAIGIGQSLGGIVGMTTFMTFSSVFPGNFSLIYIALPVFGIANCLAGVLFQIKVNESIYFPESKPDITISTQINPINNKSSGIIVALIVLIGAILLANINMAMSKPFIQAYLLVNITNDPLEASIVYIPAGLFALLVAGKLGKIVDRANLKVAILVVTVLGAGITALLIQVRSIYIFAILLVLDHSFAQVGELVLANVFSRISKNHRGKIMGLQSFSANLGGSIGPILGGILWDSLGTQSPFLVSIGVELLISPFFILAIKLIAPFSEEQRDRDLTTQTSNSVET